eukprot:CAMPEP_0116873784 /NCGR_PEP_ID=MMETSP0463-20121206/5077_1 /TAXON_ID=181622 /ORGANISM="Strombidinopsis sp, Strain SopsisLIS2011" /LENGTH=73 /DNA_ID=CAMNT_0004516437 /DNA_START=1084 /DNA_END=1305 /DNA_ORIENTATION=+
MIELFQDDIISLRVPNLYKLELGLPVKVDRTKACSFFDCKIRKLIIVLPKFVVQKEVVDFDDIDGDDEPEANE